ncbi:MAG: TetR/AcrR family transcriptional regulator [Lachnospiraceae bacterium]|nr:TetR/AcrR family transcriptional regulator [Lachnospiraceae bacterium]
MPEEQSTLDRILCSAKQEFMEKGFLNASLRSIVKNAGVTTGAFYRYYDSKEALFAALVDEPARYVLDLFNHTVDDFEKLPGEVQTKRMTEISGNCMNQMLDYVYDHFDAFKLLIQRAEGTSYADFIHQLVVREVDSTYVYMRTLEDMGYEVAPLNKNLIHIIASGLFTAIFEAVVHDMPKEEAKEYLSQLQRFNSAGWSELLNVRF